MKERILVNVLRVDSGFHLVLLGIYVEHPARACCIFQHCQKNNSAKASALKADKTLCEKLSANALAMSRRDVTSLSLTDK